MKTIFLLLLLGFCLSTHAQIDNGTSGISIPAEKSETENITPQENSTNASGSLVVPNEEKSTSLAEPKKESPVEIPEDFSMFGEEFGNPGELYEQRIKKHAKYTDLYKRENKTLGNTTNQFLGNFTTNSEYANIVYRDFGAFDGDHVRILVNDEVVKAIALLTPEFTGFKYKLEKGINKIDFYALDTGKVAPNTAEFKVADDDGAIITGNSWGLAKGVKATLVIIKE